jgi:hypothetical protein
LTFNRNILSKIFRLEALVVIYFTLLLLFGTKFTKFNVVGPLYLHDLLLGLLTLLAMNNKKKIVIRFLPVVCLIVLGFIYLIFSLLVYRPHGEFLLMTFRQFNLIVYLLCSYIIFNSLIKEPSQVNKPIALIKYIALASVALQVVFILYGFMFIPRFGLFSEGEYNYFSPLVIFGVIAYGGYVLAFENRPWKRYVKFTLCILLSTTLGHSSAFFALFIILLIHLFVKITPLQRLIAIGLGVVAILSLFLLPQFTDFNAGWRLLFWKHVLQRLVVEKYMTFGFGFGQAYMTNEYATYLNYIIHSPVMMDSYTPWARYVTPPHNSLLSIAFHLGLLPSLLIFFPLKRYFSRIFFKATSQDQNTNFLIYVLTGSFVWICFNVILELPHAATYFWLVYFTTALYLNKYKIANPK